MATACLPCIHVYRLCTACALYCLYLLQPQAKSHTLHDPQSACVLPMYCTACTAAPGGEHDLQVARLHDPGRPHLHGRPLKWVPPRLPSALLPQRPPACLPASPASLPVPEHAWPSCSQAPSASIWLTPSWTASPPADLLTAPHLLTGEAGWHSSGRWSRLPLMTAVPK